MRYRINPDLHIRIKERVNRNGSTTRRNGYYRMMDNIILRECSGKITTKPMVVSCLVKNGFPIKDAQKYVRLSGLLKRVGVNKQSVNIYRIGRGF